MNSQRGFGLLEILVTLVLLGVGAAGLVTVSRGSLTAVQESRHYEVAMRLAESKLDEFRNFNGVVSATSPLTAYNSIVPGSGSKTVSNGGNSYSYNLSWTVADQYWNDVSAVWQTTVPANYPFSYSGRKLVTVTVGWTDNQNQGRSLQLAGAISSHMSLTKAQLNNGLDTSNRPKPVVNYTPGSVPDVVSVDLGDGTKKETSKPLPKIEGGNSNSLLVQFESTTYKPNVGNSTGKQSLQDMATVYCSCKTLGVPANTEPVPYLPSKPYYAMSERVQYWQTGARVSKPVGDISGNSNNQATLCGSCCREHYDVSDKGFFGYYSPLNLNRDKYSINGSTLEAVTSGNYIDACRFIRIDGVYQPAPDWHLVSLTVFADGFLKDPNNLANYQAYIAYVVKTHAKWQRDTFGSRSDTSWSAVSATPAILSFNDWLAANRAGSPTTAVVTGVGQNQLQLISRGIYVDIMAPSYLTEQVFKDTNGQSLAEPILAKIPFQDVNMTLLSRWTSTDSTKATVTSQPINTILDPANSYYGTYSRGVLTTRSTTYSGTPPVDSPITISTTSFQGNSGVVGTAIQESDKNSNEKSATIQVSIQNTANVLLKGVIECSLLKTTGSTQNPNYSADPCKSETSNGLNISSSSNVTCQRLTQGGVSQVEYSCSGLPGTPFTLTVGKSGYRATPAMPVNLILPSTSVAQGPCVMLVEQALLDKVPSTPTTCTSQP